MKSSAMSLLRKVADIAELRRHADRLELEAMVAAAFPGADISAAAAAVKALKLLHAEQVSETKRANASNPRKSVSRAKLIAFKDKHVKDHGSAHGWIKAACLEFGITRKTLNGRLVE